MQFAAEADQLFAEAPSVGVVRDADEAVLRAAGWQQHVDAGSNWTSPLALPALTSEYADLASRCVAALRDAYGVVDSEELGYRAWRDAEQIPAEETWSAERVAQLDRGTETLDLPMLGIAPN